LTVANRKVLMRLIWNRKVVTKDTLSVKVNANVGLYFTSYKEVRQGDPFAPFLFNMAVNSLAKWSRQQNGLFTSLDSNLLYNWVAMLQYANGTILFFQDDLQQARNLKSLFYIFESISVLKINFEKSEVMLIMEDDNKAHCFAELFNCQKGSWPIKYLGTPVCAKRTTIVEMSFLGEKTRKKMSGWISNSMSIEGRMIKIDACISAVYQMSMRLLHKTNIEQMDKPIRYFFWDGSADKRKYHFVRWK
jgi:hypothetical protein